MKAVSCVSYSYNSMVTYVSTIKISVLITLNHNIEWPMFRSIFD